MVARCLPLSAAGLMATTAPSPATTFSGTTLPTVWNLRTRRSLFGDAVLVVFLLAQCFDGVFTYIGVSSFGLGVEANPLVASVMATIGHGAGLIAVKGL